MSTQTEVSQGSSAASPSYLTEIRWVFSDSLVMARRSLTRYFRVPTLLVGVTLQPVIFILLFTYVFGGAIGGAIQAPG